MNKKNLAIGNSDFKEIITGDYYYVDKSLFIKEIIDRGDGVILLPRPRRFGKTLNISMLKYFYDCCPESFPMNKENLPHEMNSVTPNNSYQSLFDSLAIKQAGKKYLEKMGKHPVIFLTFKNIKERYWESCLDGIKRLIQDEYAKHYYLLHWPDLYPYEKTYIENILALKGNSGDYSYSLVNLLKILYRYYQQKVVILIDEYDTPIHSGFSNNYYDDVIGFMRNFLGSGFKDTDQYLEKGVLTGILRIAKESIFSGLNNAGVYTVLSEEFSDKFGFTVKEMENILNDFNLTDKYDEVQQWYNGYVFGKETIYNPWSIINFLASKGNKFETYWINTASNEILEHFLSKGGKELNHNLEQLYRGEKIEKQINENIVMKYIEKDEELLWSFLLMSGYLKQTDERRTSDGENIYYSLSIPNREVKIAYKQIINNYFKAKIENNQIETMLEALLLGDISVFEEKLKKVVNAVFSFHDFGDEPEKVYHALVLGFLVWISGTHEIKSNRESGFGRYDIMIIPKDLTRSGFIIEFKKVRKNETVETAIESALNQIEEKKYETELIERGITIVKKMAIVFNGKEVYVKEK